MFGELWVKMIQETEFGPKIREGNISILFVVNDPNVVMYVDEKGPIFGADAEAKTPSVTMKMDGDTVHKFWLNKVNIPKALALRQIKAKGPVGTILQLLPLLKPGQAIYPEFCKKYNLPMEV
jgi:putative sterol carrier protein